jgi:hypothetical protein
MDSTNPNQILQSSHANIYELSTSNTKKEKVGDHYVHACMYAA